jgi:hypothetical protein
MYSWDRGLESIVQRRLMRTVPSPNELAVMWAAAAQCRPQERARLLIRGVNGKPIALDTFKRAFADEIAVGTIEMDTIAVTTWRRKCVRGICRQSSGTWRIG